MRDFKKFVFAILFVFADSSNSMIHDFVHCHSEWEKNRISTYSNAENGKTELLSDIGKILELKFSSGSTVPWDKNSKSVFQSRVTNALCSISKTSTGYALLETLITKLSLRREVILFMHDDIDCYLESIKKNDLISAANALYDMARVCIGSVSVSIEDINKAIGVFSSIKNVKILLDSMLIESGWEIKCGEFLCIHESKSDQQNLLLNHEDLSKISCIADTYRISDRITQLLDSYLNTTKIQLTNEQIDAGHVFYVSPGENFNVVNICFSILNDMLVYTLPYKSERSLSDIETVRKLTFNGKEKEISFPKPILRKRKVTFEEVLFHELNHCLHVVENNSDVAKLDDPIEKFEYACKLNISESGSQNSYVNISNDLTKDWINNEELRNGTGVVVMKNGDIRRDLICTYRYDLECSRTPRWPYRDISENGNTTIGDFVQYIEDFFYKDLESDKESGV